MWYNEAFLAPFFLRHYDYANKIYLLLDTDTDDDTRKICNRYGNVEIEDFTFPDMMDDSLKIKKINEVVAAQKADWVFAVDADEFIFPAYGEEVTPVLMRQTANLLYAQMWQVYRHATDADLDPLQPAIYQRRHGDPNITTGINSAYVKPIIVRPEIGIGWRPGCHAYKANEKISISPERFLGAHWQMADVNMAIDRRIKGRRERQSKNNLQSGMTYQHHHITEDAIRAECLAHMHDPQVF
jgi:hypothetical protein